MDWKELHDRAMEALIEGDNDQAIGLWKQSITQIEKTKPQPTVEMSQLYYGLGKTLIGDAPLEESIALLSRAEEILHAVEPSNSILGQVQYDLGNLLAKAGKSNEATEMRKSALGLVDEPIAKCLAGACPEDLEIQPMIKALQNEGLAKELNAKEFDRLKDLLVEYGRADLDDTSSINPFDLLYEYYLLPNRQKADSCRPWEVDCDFDFSRRGEQLKATAKMLNDLIGEKFVNDSDVAIVTVEPWSDTSGDKIYCVAVDSLRLQGVPMHAGADEACLIYVYNKKLSERNDPRRLLRLASYDDREMVMLLPIDVAARLYFAGAGGIFESLSEDLEPELFARDLTALS